MKLNRNTEKAQRFITRYDCSEVFTLSECYVRYSEAKERAYRRCHNICYEMNGWGFRIMSYNSQMFTCGWLYEDKETGVIMLNVETAYNSYQIEY